MLGWEAASVAGFYTSTAGRLYVVQGSGAAGSGQQAAVLVHELGHALQDQHTPLIQVTVGLRANDDLRRLREHPQGVLTRLHRRRQRKLLRAGEFVANPGRDGDREHDDILPRLQIKSLPLRGELLRQFRKRRNK